MPRNPAKQHCHVPGCAAWAMRGHLHCRAHRDPELGPRAAGPPPGNLNALKTAAYAYPFHPPELQDLALRLARDPAGLPAYFAPIIDHLHQRARDPLQTLLLLGRLLDLLRPFLADSLFTCELQAYLQTLPEARRPTFETAVWKNALVLDPAARLEFLRRLIRQLEKKQLMEKQLPGQNRK